MASPCWEHNPRTARAQANCGWDIEGEKANARLCSMSWSYSHQKTQLVSVVAWATGSWNRSLERRWMCKSFVYQDFDQMCLLCLLKFAWQGTQCLHAPGLYCPSTPGCCQRNCIPLSHQVRLHLSLDMAGDARASGPVELHSDATRWYWEQWLRLDLGASVCVGCWAVDVATAPNLASLLWVGISSWGFPSGPDICSPEPRRLICWVQCYHFFCHSLISLSFASMLSVILHSCPEC